MWVLLGILLLATLSVDVFITVFYPGPRSMEKALREYVDDVLARFVAPLDEQHGDSLRESLSDLNRYMRYE